MLPSLTAAFVLGLLCGSQISFFPLSVIILLAGIAVGFNMGEGDKSADSLRTSVGEFDASGQCVNDAANLES